LLAPANDARALATAFRTLIENPSQRATMARAARERAVTHFSLARQIDSLLQTWEEALS
jgi:glycosyltransferase involved in cell wall biosynthesis